MKRTFLLSTVLVILFYSCNTNFEYAEKIDDCFNAHLKNSKGKLFLYENPLRECYNENVIGIQFPDYSLRTDKKDTIVLSEIEKPIVLIVLDRFIKTCVDRGNNIWNLVEKYHSEIEFVVLVNEMNLQNYNLMQIAGKKPDNYIEFHDFIRVITYDEKDVKETGKTSVVKGIKCAGYPMTYFLSKDLIIDDIETNEDIYISENILDRDNNDIPYDSIQVLDLERYEKYLRNLLEQ
ncbi:MAG: hypothetical protein ACQETL_19840 [Bacteroidota bacterium]